ncbi:Protein of unknown function [Nitrosomonas halophila]|uniref:Uncharacterized protein n=1 Tax=Nitrosomonas halophila TaxID=44576 RepID=A0A1H3ILA6_9PROT|nr:Protein of unknown function [Nitrosomonas halophila]
MLQTALTIDNPNLQSANDFIIGHEPGVLARIYDKGIQMSVFRRTLETEVQQYANFLQREQIGFQLTKCVSLHQVESLLATSLPRHGARHHFIQDVSNIVDMFACLPVWTGNRWSQIACTEQNHVPTLSYRSSPLPVDHDLCRPGYRMVGAQR